MIRAHSRRAARNLAISSRKLLWALKKNDSRWPNALTSRPASTRGLDVGDRVGQRERDLLNGGRAGLADVIAADRDRIPLRHVLARRTHDVGHDPERRARRVDVGAARDVLLEDVVLDACRRALPARCPAASPSRRTARAG